MALDLEEQEQVAELKAWWNQHGNLIVSAITAAALAFAGWQGWRWYERSQATQAGALYDTIVRAAGAGDAKALRIAGNILQIFRPQLLCVSLTSADVAHGSYNAYVDVIRRNDQELGRIVDTVNGDPQLKDSTSIFVLPEFGRDRDLNLRRGLDHGDDSDELHKVALVAWGPDFRKGRVVNQEVRSLDVMPTVAGLFGAPAGGARGTPLPGLLA